MQQETVIRRTITMISSRNIGFRSATRLISREGKKKKTHEETCDKWKEDHSNLSAFHENQQTSVINSFSS